MDCKLALQDGDGGSGYGIPLWIQAWDYVFEIFCIPDSVASWVTYCIVISCCLFTVHHGKCKIKNALERT